MLSPREISTDEIKTIEASDNDASNDNGEVSREEWDLLGACSFRACNELECHASRCSGITAVQKFVCTGGRAVHGCSDDRIFWGSTPDCDGCCDATMC